MVEKRPPKNPIRYGTLYIPEGLLAQVRKIAAANRTTVGEAAAILLVEGMISAQAKTAAAQTEARQGTEDTPTA